MIYLAPSTINPTEVKAALIALFDSNTDPESTRANWEDDVKAVDALKSLQPQQIINIGGQTFEVAIRNSIVNLSPVVTFNQFVL